MPKVGDREFPYTAEGERQARQYASERGKPLTNDNSFGYARGGEVGWRDEFEKKYPAPEGFYDKYLGERGGEVDNSKNDFLKAYKRGNAYMWGRLKGDSGMISGIKDIWQHGNQFNKYQEDPGFKEFVNATTTPEKLAVIEKYFGDKVAFEFGDYEMKDWDEHFRRQSAVFPQDDDSMMSAIHGDDSWELEPKKEGMQRGGRVGKFGY